MPHRKRSTEKQMIEKWAKDTHFNKTEVQALVKQFKRLCSDAGKDANGPGHKSKLSRQTFRDILHNTFNMTDDILMDRVFRAFDKDSDSYVSMDEYIKGLSIFIKGNKQENLKFCFHVYDLNGDGYISREEMFHLLKTSIIKPPTEEDPDEGIKDLVEMNLKKMDHDHDTRLSFDDYKLSVELDNLLLEAFGPCLPDDKMKEAFLEVINEAPPTR